MSDKEKEDLEKVKAPTLQDLFEGVKGRRPKSLDEFATDEGKEATIFESTSVSRWGGRS
jgi:predicted transcriptional regulator